MKSVLKILLFVLAFAFCIGFISYSNSLTENQIHLIENSNVNKAQLKYHFAVIAQNINESFWQSVKSGADSAGASCKAAIEFTGPSVRDEDEELKYLKIAIASRVDGIAIYVTNKSKFTPLINKAVENGIRVVTIESDDKTSHRSSYIGPDAYNVGAAEALLASKAESETANVALILSGNYSVSNDAGISLLNGFKQSLKSSSKIRLSTVKNSNSGYFEAEKIIRDILYNYPEINTVVCTSSNDTLEVAQVLIDLNKTNKITVIGYSNSQQIRSYIKNNVIYGSVYENPKDTGYKSIQCLFRLMTGETPQDTINTGVYTITKDNLVNYPDGS